MFHLDIGDNGSGVPHLNPGFKASVDETMDDELDRQVGLEPVGQHGLLVVNLQDPLLQQ